MLQKTFLSLLVATLTATFCTAQEIWSLPECIAYARQNSLSIKQARYTVQDALLAEKQSKFDRLPNANASVRAGYQFGRTIDPTTNAFENARIGFNTYSL
ncbi:MAG: TolC family protein, partial [Saprospiraceae bacterium]|nr:TolC family protein [Saprospiraceae bacterium]